MERRKIIMDVDTGSDDALALMMAMLDEHFDLLGITTVNGNVNVDLTTDNTLRVVELCGRAEDVRVYKGCAYPIASTLMPWMPQHQVTPRAAGSKDAPWARTHPDHLPLPAPKTRAGDESAVVWLINTLLAAEDGEITLIPVGPLTNIAVALRADPRIIPKIREMVIMAGGHRVHSTTTSPCSEFNVWIDPEAMEIVAQSGCKITMVPLDATHQAICSTDDAKILRGIGTSTANFFADMIEQRAYGYSFWDTDMKAQCASPIHDALAVCAVIHPDVLKDVIHCNMHTDISRGFAYGQTILDRRLMEQTDPPNVYFALNADRELFFNWIVNTLQQDKARKCHAAAERSDGLREDIK